MEAALVDGGIFEMLRALSVKVELREVFIEVLFEEEEEEDDEEEVLLLLLLALLLLLV